MKRIIMLTGALALTGCGGTPDCGSDDALGVVTDIVYDGMAETFVQAGHIDVTRSRLVDAMQLEPTLVRMTDYDEKIDTYSCDATMSGWRIDLETLGSSTSKYEEEITFTISPSAQGGGEFIVEVFGI